MPMHIKAILIKPSGLKQNKTKQVVGGSCQEKVYQREWKDTKRGEWGDFDQSILYTCYEIVGDK